MKDLKGFGKKSEEELTEKLQHYGLHLSGECDKFGNSSTCLRCCPSDPDPDVLHILNTEGILTLKAVAWRTRDEIERLVGKTGAGFLSAKLQRENLEFCDTTDRMSISIDIMGLPDGLIHMLRDSGITTAGEAMSAMKEGSLTTGSWFMDILKDRLRDMGLWNMHCISQIS